MERVRVGGIEAESGRTFSLLRGITQEQVLQLISFSGSDSAVLRFTSDPVRFENIEAFNRWLDKGRIIYTLSDQEGNLQGIVWFGEKSMPDANFIENFDKSAYGITFAIRVYGQARGRGISPWFLTETVADLKKTSWYQSVSAGGIWLATSQNNISAIKLYQKTGWKQVSTPDEKGRILMVLLSGFEV